MTKYILSLLLLTSLYAEQNHYTLLGKDLDKLSEDTQTKNSIVWEYYDGRWSASKPYEKLKQADLNLSKTGYILLAQEPNTKKTPLHSKQTLTLQKGWNHLLSPKDGIDIEKSFAPYGSSIDFVYSYDPLTQAWAAYSADEKIQEQIRSTRILWLKSIEPHKELYIYARKTVALSLEPIAIGSQCMEMMQKDSYHFITSSGLDKDPISNPHSTLFLKSRYIGHYKRGIYDDTRITLIYPKKEIKGEAKLNYGPAEPKAAIKYAKEYEDETFYMFDYKNKGCYEGVFPSMKKPPIAALKKL